MKLLYYAPRIKCLQLSGPDENNPGCKIEEYDHAELVLVGSIASFSRKVSAASLEEAQDGLMLKLPHRV